MQVLAVQIAGIPVNPTANTLRLHNYGTLISEIRTMQAVSAANVPPDPCCAVRRPCHQRFGVATSRHGRSVVCQGAVRYGRVLTVVGCGMQWYPDCVRIVRGITGVRKIRTQIAI